MFIPLSIAVPHGNYHGCFNVYENGIRLLINHDAGEECPLSTNDPFWKRTKDVDFKIQTRLQKSKNKIAKREHIINYLSQ